MIKTLKLNTIVAESQLGQRLDQALAKLFPDYSRSCIKKWILADQVIVNGKKINKPRNKVLGNEFISINAQMKEDNPWIPQAIFLDIVYEDNDILVINKPRSLIVHPGAGNIDGTILNALIHFYPAIINVPRAGIVHRLDKNTTGLMVVAKTIPAHTYLVQALQKHKIIREYEAIVIGNIISGGIVEKPITRHPVKRTHMIVHLTGKPAITHYRVIEHFRAYTHLQLCLKTGRTHQIRVHMSHIQHSLVGDPMYSGQLSYPKDTSDILINKLRNFNRQALHATMLRLLHPISRIPMEWHAALPEDMATLITLLQADKKNISK
ncbi:23S rRNA pseudouridine(1911/1915/1917) synthase RluD [Candidatus Fukatsuia anoeciicola]|uniref:23S rRNA pseudouridine(1911/1915/1917) synthase RluD n=1 Tax=Candidatus Fukatsuia anoeciicola TaxID=2994492 RepID=UPI0034639ED8